MKRGFLILLVLFSVTLAAAYLWPAPQPVSHVYFDGATNNQPEAIAHGGGLGHAPANTLLALDRAISMGADVLEVDVQQTADGVMILRHDDTLDRTTDMKGLIADYSWQELALADAGEHTEIDGTSYAGQGIHIPTLDDALAAFPGRRWVLEIKNDTEAAARAMCESIRGADAEERVLVGSFHDDAMGHFRRACPDVATSMASGEVRGFVIMARLGLSRFVSTPAVAMQIPVEADGVDLVHPRLIDAAHARGFLVQYWTINQPDEMARLIEAGADGLITDYVERVDDVLAQQEASERSAISR